MIGGRVWFRSGATVWPVSLSLATSVYLLTIKAKHVLIYIHWCYTGCYNLCESGAGNHTPSRIILNYLSLKYVSDFESVIIYGVYLCKQSLDIICLCRATTTNSGGPNNNFSRLTDFAQSGYIERVERRFGNNGFGKNTISSLVGHCKCRKMFRWVWSWPLQFDRHLIQFCK